MEIGSGQRFRRTTRRRWWWWRWLVSNGG